MRLRLPNLAFLEDEELLDFRVQRLRDAVGGPVVPNEKKIGKTISQSTEFCHKFRRSECTSEQL